MIMAPWQNRLTRIGALAAALAACAAVEAAALDLSLDLGLSDRYHFRYASEAGARLESDLSVGQGIGDLYLGAELWSSSRLGGTAASLARPAEEDLSASAEYAIGPASLGATGTIYARDAGTSYDLGAYARASLPLAGDLLGLDGELRAMEGFPGLYAEARLGPYLSLPLTRPLSLGLQGRLGYLGGGYGGLSYSGLSSLALQGEASLMLDRSYGLRARGGYSFDLSGGSFASHPFFGLVFEISASAGAE